MEQGCSNWNKVAPICAQAKDLPGLARSLSVASALNFRIDLHFNDVFTYVLAFKPPSFDDFFANDESKNFVLPCTIQEHLI